MRALALSLLIVAVVAAYTGYSALNAQTNEPPCVVAILNRTAFVNHPAAAWQIDNVPSNMGLVRARMTCVRNGETISGQSDFFEIIPNVITNLDAPIVLGQVEPIPESLDIITPTETLTTATLTAQLTVIATYPDGAMQDVTLRELGTNYVSSNPAIATISDNGLVTAISSGAALILASNEEVIQTIFLTILLSADSDADGIPDDYEVANGMNPNDPVDAMEDIDGDGLTALSEFQRGTDPNNADTDNDTINDGEEIVAGADGFITNPLLADSDGDQIRDALEISVGTDPTDKDDFDFSLVLTGITVQPGGVALIVNAVVSEATAQLIVTGHLIDGNTANLTPKSTGTRYFSSDLLVVNFGIEDGKLFAGQDGSAVITVSNGAFEQDIPATVSTFTPLPLSVTNLPTTGFGNAIEIVDDIAYIADGANGLLQVFLGNRQSPTLGFAAPTNGSAKDVKIVGDLAYVADTAGLTIIDLTTQAEVGAVSTPGNARDVAVRGDYAYIADSASGLQIIDISDPANPVIVGALDTDGDAKGIDIAGDVVVIADGPNGAKFIDVSDPTAPSLISSVTVGGDARDVEVQNTTAYFAAFVSNGFRPVDFTDPTNPVVGTVAITGGDLLQDVAIANRFAFGADVVRPNGVPMYDIGDSNNPLFRAVMDFFSLGDANGLAIAADDNFVYLVAGGISDQGDTGGTQLYIGQYLSLQDPYGIPPTVSITSPLDGGAIYERGFARITANASDDVFVNSVTFTIDGEPVFTDFGEPFVFPFPVPEGAEQYTFSAIAVDLGGNTATAEDVTVTVEEPTERIVSTAAAGTAAVIDLPSANPGQVILLESDAPGVFNSSTQVTFPTINDNGVEGTAVVNVQGVGPDGATATVTVPLSANTGGVEITGVPAVPALQIVPRLDSFSNADFAPGVNLGLTGRGFIEGAITARFGAVSVIDPDAGTGTINVFNTNSSLNITIPAGASSSVVVQTAGGTSNSLIVGPGAFDGFSSTAAFGTPANPGVSSANIGQTLTILGSDLKPNANVLFPSVDDSGALGVVGARIANISLDGTRATVVVPNNATTGNVTMLGTTGAFQLQIVPRITSFINNDYSYSLNSRTIQLSGSGFVEGQISVNFGGFDITDLDTTANVIDVFSSGTGMNVPVPNRASSVVTVTTAGGVSNSLQLSASEFNSVSGTAGNGTPADSGVPSANVGQAISLTGKGFRTNTNVWFPARDDSGNYYVTSSRVTWVSLDGTRAEVIVPNTAISGLITVPGSEADLPVPADLGLLTEVYSNDFELAAGPEWSNQTRTTTSGEAIPETTYLGRFGNDQPQFTLTGLPDHESVVIEWDQLILDTWDSGDRFGILQPGVGIYEFDKSFPGGSDAFGVGRDPDVTGEFGTGNVADRLYQDMRLVIPHSGDTLELIFYGASLQALADESWGIDNLRVLVDDTPLPADTRHELQVVPAISSFSVGNFSYSLNSRILTLNGSGFAENEVTVNFGGFDIADPDVSANVIDVFSSGTGLNVPVPSRPGGLVTVSTDGGVSNALQVAASTFTGITSAANAGTPADAGAPSANIGQTITLHGSGFNLSESIWFPSTDDSGLASVVTAQPTWVSPDRTTAEVIVPAAAGTGFVTVPGSDQDLPAPADLGALAEVYSNDFEIAPGPEWSNSTRTVTTGTDIPETSYLGRFGNDQVRLTLSGLPAHESIVIEWDLFTLDSWDSSSDRFGIIQPGVGAYEFDRSFPGGIDAHRVDRAPDVTGEFGPIATFADRLYQDMSLVIPHSGDTLELIFYGAGLQALTDESWGIDNIRVLVDDAPLPQQTRHFLQVVPSLGSFSVTNFMPSGASRTLTLNGGGFVEGGITTSFGGVNVVDPDTSFNTIDVFSSGTSMNSVIPASPGGLVTVITAGGTSNGLQIGPVSLSGVTSTASFGTPADGGFPSANVGQTVFLSGAGFRTNQVALFTGTDDAGASAQYSASLGWVSLDGTQAEVAVPAGASTGVISVYGASGSFTLQIVPRITSASVTTFYPSGASRTVSLGGGGFVEAAITVNFGSAPVFDPDATFNTIDVFSSGTNMNSIIPPSPGGLVSVTTAGGTSNAVQLGPSAFTSIEGLSPLGTPTDSGASANAGGSVLVTGVGLGSNSVLEFPSVNDSGAATVVTSTTPSFSPDRSEAWFTVPNGAVSGPVTLVGAGSLELQVVPRIDSVSFTSFTTGSQIQVFGSGFVEGAITVHFGGVDVVDPDTGTVTVNVDSSGTRTLVNVPGGAGTAISVTTAGGTSNVYDIELPSVRIVNPADETLVAAGDVLTVNALATDVGGIADVNFLVDGVEATSTLDDVFAMRVDGRSNIFLAGGNAGSGAGLAPPGITFAATAGQRFVALGVSGIVSGSAGCEYNRADGGRVCGNGGTNVASSAGVSGIIHGDLSMFLVGVFTDGTTPVAPAPGRLTETDANDSVELTPLLNQTFFIGDGRTASGQMQEIVVPTGATQLYLGFVETSGFTSGGAPGSYVDNAGTITVGLALVDSAPSSFTAVAMSGTVPATSVYGHLFMTLPAAPDTLSFVARTTDTDANVTDSSPISVDVVAGSFTPVAAATFGVPADVGLPSANANQVIELTATYSAFDSRTLVIFPVIDDVGNEGVVWRRVAFASADGTRAVVQVPQNAVTGTVEVDGVGSFTLQVTPRLTGFTSAADFAPGVFIGLQGLGFIEGDTTVSFGTSSVTDPDTGSGTIDITSTGANLNLNSGIPSGPGGLVTVTTAGGTSNGLQVGPASFTGIDAIADFGAPADPGLPSANAGQTITITGVGLRTNTNVQFQAINASGVPVVQTARVSSVNVTGAAATVVVPLEAVTGSVSLIGTAESAILQSVPRLFGGFSNSDFVTGVNLQITGRGFIEGQTTVNFGSLDFSDPDISSTQFDVFSSNTVANITIPAGAGGLVSISTDGGVSNAVQMGPSAFSSLTSFATFGAPADAGVASANPGQTITVAGIGLRANTNVLFPQVDASGIPGTVNVGVSGVNAQGTEATVVVPLQAVTGAISLFGAPESAQLQSVPRLFGNFSNSDFAPGVNLQLNGRGFVEGETTVRFETTDVVDPDTSSTTLDVFSSNATMNVTIPQAPGGLLSIITPGGVSNQVQIGPSSFIDLPAVATFGTPADAGAPSVNGGQVVTVLGTGLGANSNVLFPTIDINGITGFASVRVTGAKSDGSEATIATPLDLVTGDISLIGAPETALLQSVPRVFGFATSDFNAGVNIRLDGRGFIEGQMTVSFGDVDVIDPDSSFTIVDVFNSNASVNVTTPSGAGGLVTVTTPGGVSNEFRVGAESFTSIAAVTPVGTPADDTVPSAYAGQTITLHGSGFTGSTNAIFPIINDSGVAGFISVRVSGVSTDGSEATVVTPVQVVTGQVTVFGAPEAHDLQSVPRIFSATLNQPFGEGVNLRVDGRGFVEGAVTVNFGPVDVIDPDIGFSIVDVFSSSQSMNVTIPAGAEPTVQVITDGGSSNLFEVISDPFEQAPSVEITSPFLAQTVFEGGALPITVAASDDVFLKSVVVQVLDPFFEEVASFSRTLPPFESTYFVPLGSPGQLVIRATAEDVGGNVAVSDDIIVNVSASPITIDATAASGVPGTSSLPSANTGQSITINAPAGTFSAASTVQFPIRNDVGAASSVNVVVSSFSPSGDSATVTVPPQAVTGGVSVTGVDGNAALQVVPVLTGFSNSQFRPGVNVQLNGSGFAEGAITVNFGGTPVADPNNGSAVIDVFGFGAFLNVTVPGGPGSSVTVTTQGGTSAPLLVGPTSFTGITASAGVGTPADGGLPSANQGQAITIAGSGFASNTIAQFPAVDTNGVLSSVVTTLSSISPDGTSATVVVPSGATSGPVTLPGATGSVELQVVPVLSSFSNADFRPSGVSRSMQLNGSGFVEGAITVTYSFVDVVDPDVSANIIDVWSSGNLSVIIPDGAGAVATVTTPGGTSNQLTVGPTSFTAVNAVAGTGTPADGGAPSANVGQIITIVGSDFRANTNLIFPSIDDSGVTGSVAVRVTSVNLDGSEATVSVPATAVMGDLTMPGNAGSHSLQVVPVISSFSNADFSPSGASRNLQLNGSGYIEGAITVHFGGVDVTDPNISSPTIDVFSSGTSMNTVIPSGAGGSVSVTTSGGTSNAFQVGPATFTGILASAGTGTPADGGAPSANNGQLITVTGSGFKANTNVFFPSVDDSGIAGSIQVRVTSVNLDGTEATVVVPSGAATGQATVAGTTGSVFLQIVPRLSSYSVASFAPSGASRNLTLSGGGFIEAGITVHFGGADVTDPDRGSVTIDVYSSGTNMNTVIPSSPGGLVSVTTAGGTSNALQIGPSSFSGVAAVASFGSPADPGEASANVGQTLALSGSGFNTSQVVAFPSIDDSGVATAVWAGIGWVSLDGTDAEVTVPAGAATGDISIFGATGSFELQVVPRITSYSNSSFYPSGASRNLTLGGSGFIESGITVNFGSTPVADPDSSANTIDVYSTGTNMNSVIPSSPGGLVSVTTAGGTSNAMQIGPSTFSSISGATLRGTPGSGLTPASNAGQSVRVTGVGIDSSSVLAFPGVDDNGSAVTRTAGPSSVDPDGTEALFTVPHGTVTGPVTLVGATPPLPLQVVPHIDSLSFTSFTTGTQLLIFGGGFVEGAITVHFGGVSVVDPNIGTGTVNVDSTGTRIIINIPAGAGTAVSVTTSGGTSNVYDVELPSVRTTGPADGSSLAEGDATTVTALATDVAGIDDITFLVDGVEATPTLDDVFAARVDGRSNIFLAGGNAGVGAGLAPPGITFTATPGQRIVVLDTSGVVSGWANGCEYNGADGGQVCGNGGTNVASSGGISGLIHGDRSMFLVGVFTDGTAPVAPAPDRLTATGANDAAELTPSLNQTFFIGDGRTTSGQMQEIVVPTGATQLYLGFVETSGFTSSGAPGAYNDNGGSVTVGLALVDSAPTAFTGIALSSATPGSSVYGHLFMMMPAAPDSLVVTARATDTDANSADSSAITLHSVLATFAPGATATFGVPADGGLPSANANQLIELNASYRAFNLRTLVTFPVVDNNGVVGTVQRRVLYASEDGMRAVTQAPQDAVTGTVTVDGVGSFTLQVVPRLTGFSSINDFVPGSFIRFSGSGFVDGDITVSFGSVSVTDPDGGTGTIDVNSTGANLNLNSGIPASPGGLVLVTTTGGTSNSFQVGPAALTGIEAVATFGTPANPGLPSANPGQTVTITGIGLRSITNVEFPVVNASGVAGIERARVSSVNVTGTEATVVVPLQAVTGPVTLIGATQSVELQSVPRLFGSFTNNDFVTGVNLQITGRGFIEGATTVHFGAVDFTDPNVEYVHFDVFNSNASANISIPPGAGGLVSVTTDGGTSNPVQIGPASFTGVLGAATFGTPTDGGVASANPGQTVTITGSGFRSNTVVQFPAIDQSGNPYVASVAVSGLNAAGTQATVVVPLEAVTGQITVFGTAGTISAPADLSGLAEVYSSDFEAAAGPEWSNQTRTTTTGTDIPVTSYLGRFANQSVALTLTGLPDHTSLVLEWDQLILDSWDGSGPNGGPDRFGIFVAGIGFIDYEKVFPSTSGWPSIGVDPDVTGEFGPVATYADRYYQGLTAAIPHSGDSVTIVFFGAGLQGVGDESWGIDNLSVLADDAATPPLSRVDLQIVPRIFGFTNSDFVQGQNLRLDGRGFVEGATTVHFGAVDVVDPDISFPTVDVFSSNAAMNVAIPANAGGLISVTTAGGTSNTFQIGPATLTSIASVASFGTPADGGVDSANIGQVIVIEGSGFRTNTNVLFPSMNDQGVAGTVAARISSINAGGTLATVVVPATAVTGDVTLVGATGSFALQIVPRITNLFGSAGLPQSTNLQVQGSGFVEGAITVHFGSVDVVDPDPSFPIVDVFSSGTFMNVTVPAAAEPQVSVTTAGGTSNIVVAP